MLPDKRHLIKTLITVIFVVFSWRIFYQGCNFFICWFTQKQFPSYCLFAPALAKSSSTPLKPSALAAWWPHELFQPNICSPLYKNAFFGHFPTWKAVSPLRSLWSTSAPASSIASISDVSPALKVAESSSKAWERLLLSPSQVLRLTCSWSKWVGEPD